MNFRATSTGTFSVRKIGTLFSSMFISLSVGHLIGKGAFGFVYQGLARGITTEEKATTVAIKTVRGLSLVSPFP